MTIWKFQLDITDVQTIKLPHDAEILSVQLQDDVPCLWVLYDPKAHTVKKKIEIFGTGHRIIRSSYRRYISTFQCSNGFVGHVFIEE